MSTSGGFAAPVTPECPYAPRMTRAAALALRAANGLRENCVVVITDGPTIGTAGNTSVTEIELNPVSSNEFGQTARVNTTFDNEAWTGIYDIDAGTGTIFELRDNAGNTVKDTDTNAPTVQTQFPWHRGVTVFRDNYIEDSILTGWDVQVGLITNSDIREANLDLTAKTGGTINGAEVIGSTWTISGVLAVTRSKFVAGNITKAGTGNFTFTNALLQNDTVVNQIAGSTAPLFVGDSILMNTSTFTLGAASAGQVTLSSGNNGIVNVNHLGTAVVNVFAVSGRVSINTALGSTRQIQVNSIIGGRVTINQNGTGATVLDAITGGTYDGDSTINFNLTGGVGTGIGASRVSAATLNVNSNASGLNTILRTTVENQSVMTVDAGGSVDSCRVSNRAVVNTGAFFQQATIVEGAFTKTLTASNINRLCNKAFDDTL